MKTLKPSSLFCLLSSYLVGCNAVMDVPPAFSEKGGNTGNAGESTGGKDAVGGANVKGGTSSKGGAKATGGSELSTGTFATGGVPNSTGNSLTGGTSTIGGSSSIGGNPTTGGTSTTGGMSATGGKTTGGTSATGGTSSTGGTSTTGSKTTGGTTGASCTISSTSYPSGFVNQINPCQTCQPAISTTTWSPIANGSPCGSGKVCNSGTCQSGCWIASTFYAPDSTIPTRPCQTCKPALSTITWTSDAVRCGCTGTLQAVQDNTGLCVAKTVNIPASTSYSIDATEVTRTQYSTWLATVTSATIGGQDATSCGWNTTFTPDASCMGFTEYVCQGTGCGNHPQVCVDWCDAYAYCAGVGKRLCGKIGGGSNLVADFATASASQWYNACSSGGVNTYPYGSAYNATYCNGDAETKGRPLTTTAVGSLPECQTTSPNSGVYDLSGNVNEWEDSCLEKFVYCRVHGGFFNGNSSAVACDVNDGASNTYVSYFLGFRCCSR